VRVSDTVIIVVCIVVKSPGLCGSLLIKKEIKGRDAVMLSVLAIHATAVVGIIVIIIIKIKKSTFRRDFYSTSVPRLHIHTQHFVCIRLAITGNVCERARDFIHGGKHATPLALIYHKTRSRYVRSICSTSPTDKLSPPI